jgi:hypothetical protein
MKEKIKAIILAELKTGCGYNSEDFSVGIELWEKNKESFEAWQDGVAERATIEIMALLNIPS